MRTRTAILFTLVGSLVFALSCSSGGDIFEVTATDPTEDAQDVPVTATVRAEFSLDIDPTTLTTESFILEQPPGDAVAGTVNIGSQPNVIEFSPTEPLDVLTEFRATIQPTLASVDGQMLTEAFQWRFTSLAPAWGESELIEQAASGVSQRSHVAVDAMSNAFAVWELTVNERTSIWTARYTRRDLWGTPELLETTDTADATRPRVTADVNGNAFAIWEQDQGGANSGIWAARYTPTNGWGPAELVLSDVVSDARNPSIGADADGNAIAVWIQVRDVDSMIGVYANRYVVGQGWGTAEPIEEVATSAAGTGTEVAVSRNGDAVAVWRRPRSDNGDNVWGNNYTPSGGWGTAQLIKESDSEAATDPRVAIDTSGTAFAIWEQSDGTQSSIRSNRFDSGAWGTAELVEMFDGGDAKAPDIAADSLGNAYAVWSQSDTDFDNIWANIYDNGWGTPALIEEAFVEPLDDDDAIRPRISSNPSGNVIAVWEQTSESWASIRSNRYTVEDGWGMAQFIEDEQLPAREPTIAVDENNHAHAVWPHGNDRAADRTTIDRIRTNRFE